MSRQLGHSTRSEPRRVECSYVRSSSALAGILVTRETGNDEEPIAHRGSNRRERGRHDARHADVGAEGGATGTDSRRRGHGRGVHLGQHLHVRKNRAELFRQLIGARTVDAKARELGDVQHILTRNRHYSCPRSRVVYASLMVFLPMLSSSTSITVFFSLPVPDSSLLSPP